MDHRGQWPASLAAAYGYTHRGDGDAGQWEYRRPEKGNARVAVLFEKSAAFADAELVVFADGFVESVKDRQRLANLKAGR